MRSKGKEKEQWSERRGSIPAELQARNCQDTVSKTECKADKMQKHMY
jgi:hypothetical protein